MGMGKMACFMQLKQACSAALPFPRQVSQSVNPLSLKGTIAQEQ
ncbi:hypothetical protein J2T46_003949 [Pseudomonas citronellolis]|nr:hypothetical protein [Pseudomonas citronellolis]MCP1656599.1 hypothetical protein [Pseudomonas citronellolis]MCP1723628.1 hypothetical protein [Pseudomonas citronellolis]